MPLHRWALVLGLGMGCSTSEPDLSGMRFVCHGYWQCLDGYACVDGECVPNTQAPALPADDSGVSGEPTALPRPDGGALQAYEDAGIPDASDPDAGAPDGGSPAPDAGGGAGDAGSLDAGGPPDAGPSLPDAGPPSLDGIATAFTDVDLMSLVVPVPAGAQAGDLMIAVLALGETANLVAPNLTAPAGWTLVRRADVVPSLTLAVYQHTYAPPEPATYTWTSDEGVKGVTWIASYQGANAANPIDADATAVYGGGTSFAAPALAASVPNTLWVASFAALGPKGTMTLWTPPPGWTATANLNNADRRCAMSAQLVQPNAGSQSFAATTPIAQIEALSHVMILRP